MIVVPKKSEAPKSAFLQRVVDQFIYIGLGEFHGVSEHLPDLVEEPGVRALNNASEGLVDGVDDRAGIGPEHKLVGRQPIELVVGERVVQNVDHHGVDVFGLSALRRGPGRRSHRMHQRASRERPVVHVELHAGVEFLVPAVEVRHEVRNVPQRRHVYEAHL